MNGYEQMRDALNNIGNAAAWVAENCNDQQTAKYMNDVIAMVQSALAIPRRQCDVGTAEEQYARHDLYCREQGRCDRCDRCVDPVAKDDFDINSLCKFQWLQMPYEKEGADA